MTLLPAIDAHTHIQTTVTARDITGLRSCVVAVTRERREWARALRRRDEMALWGIGVHPGLPAEIAAFDQAAFAAAVKDALIIGEVGLDGKSKSPADAQAAVFDQVLETAAAQPRPVTIHSGSACGRVLNALRRRPIAAPILHWWRGSVQQTEEAIEMGCWFSVNGAEARSPKILSKLPRDRVLTETDFPYSRRSDAAANKPGAVKSIEAALRTEWGLDELELRRQLWGNFAELFERCALTDELPAGIQDAMLTAGM